MEWQVSSFELSKKLKELGVKQDSLYYWELLGDNITTGLPEWKIRDKFRQDEYSYSAFTVAELGEILWEMFCEQKPPIRKSKGVWGRRIGCSTENPLGIWIEDKYEANARAKILIYLAEKEFSK